MWQQIRDNKRKSVTLIFFMAGFLFLIGYVFGEVLRPGNGIIGLFTAFLIWVILTLISFYKGDSIFLSLSKARKIRPDDHKVLFNVVEEMKIASGLPKIPDIYIIDEDAPNAFAVGRNYKNASIAVTSGLLKMLDRNELQGVIAHEMSHIANRDTLYMSVVGIMMGTIILLADIGTRSLFYGGSRRRTSVSGGGQAQLILFVVAVILIILAPIIARLIYFALSRRREYLADACAAQFTRFPTGLASALEKISHIGLKLSSASRITAPMYIVNPLKVNAQGLSDLTSTHPPISERIRILRSMTHADFLGYNKAFKKATGKSDKIISKSNFNSFENIPIIQQPQQIADSSTLLDRTRDTTDMLWKLNQYIFINCSCGTNLKIPPEYSGMQISCPHCLTQVRVYKLFF
ncbi:MAG: M48 family metallopeptidase [bacterium]